MPVTAVDNVRPSLSPSTPFTISSATQLVPIRCQLHNDTTPLDVSRLDPPCARVLGIDARFSHAGSLTPYLQEHVYRNGLSKISPFVYPIHTFRILSLTGTPFCRK